MSTERPQPGQGQTEARVLTVNVGSSSIKFAFFTGSGSPERVLSGQLDQIGGPGTTGPRSLSLSGADPKG